jgi:hypothetical protein
MHPSSLYSCSLYKWTSVIVKDVLLFAILVTCNTIVSRLCSPCCGLLKAETLVWIEQATMQSLDLIVTAWEARSLRTPGRSQRIRK